MDTAQRKERDLEKEIQGVSKCSDNIKTAEYGHIDLYCSLCSISIADYHRGCTTCPYVLCLQCCEDLRAGNIRLGAYRMPVKYVDYGLEYRHGGVKKIGKVSVGGIKVLRRHTLIDKDPAKHVEPSKRWVCDENGAIPCPPEDRGGCGESTLELRGLFCGDAISKLIEEAREYNELPSSIEGNSCPKGSEGPNEESSNQYSVYSPNFKQTEDMTREDLMDFQQHWSKGEPIVVQKVIDTDPGLSWEPQAMWASLCYVNRHHKELRMTTTNCLDFSKEDVLPQNFFKGYVKGDFDSKGWPKLLMLEKWPSSKLFEEELPLHLFELLRRLPFKDYMRDGYLNMANKIRDGSPDFDMGPSGAVVYGFDHELGRGDSVTKVHYERCDMINVLVHEQAVSPTQSQRATIQNLKEKHDSQDAKELQKAPNEGGEIEGAVVWHIFRKTDVPKLATYLKENFKKFRHLYCNRVPEVIHPILDESLYLDAYHMRKLEEDHGIRAWVIVQNVGDAVIVPAGCPFQLRNLKSCTKMRLDFVSPESVESCLNLCQEYRVLPRVHARKKDSLQVGKMIVYAVRDAVSDIKGSRV
ncbi:hypothetical protein ACP275_13G033000 [Erythranthe tilingii]